MLTAELRGSATRITGFACPWQFGVSEESGELCLLLAFQSEVAV